MPPRDDRRSNPNLAGFLALNNARRETSFNARALDLASDLGDNRAGPNVNILDAFPASFGTQMEMAARRQQQLGDDRGDTTRRLNKLMLARMSTLEQGFAEVLKEVKVLSRGASSLGNSSVEGESRGKGKRRVPAAGVMKSDRPGLARIAQLDYADVGAGDETLDAGDGEAAPEAEDS